MTADSKNDPETYAILGAAMEVHRELGSGFLEGVYQDALEIEFNRRSIPFQREQPVPVLYKGFTLGSPYRADFVCYGSVIVELKAIKTLTDVESAQVLHYLKATGFERALLINFAASRLDYKRFIQSENHLRPSESSAVNLQFGGRA
jgi:GxxExxY protein